MPDRAARASGLATVAMKPPVESAMVRIDVWVISRSPPSSMAPNTTAAPAVATRARSGSAASDPNQPPAFSSSSVDVEMPSGPLMRWSRPRAASATSNQPASSRNGPEVWPLRTSATPEATRTTGTA